MSNKVYDIIASIGRIILPALATLIIAFGDTWGIPYTQEISATISAIAVFINTVLADLSKNYFSKQND